MDFRSPYTRQQQEFRAVARAWLIEHFPRELKIPPDGSPLDAENQAKVKKFRPYAGRNGLAGAVMAQRTRRRRTHIRAGRRHHGGDAADAAAQHGRQQSLGARNDGLGHGRAEDALHSAMPQRRVHHLAVLQRTRFRLRLRVRQYIRRSRRRRLGNKRRESLHHRTIRSRFP